MKSIHVLSLMFRLRDCMNTRRQLLNILHVMYLYNELKKNPDKEFYPRTFIFGAKASAGYHSRKIRSLN